MTGIIRNKVNRFYKQNVGTIIRTIIYTIGHFCIAAGVIIAVADVTLYEAMTDAIVEPLLNSMWYFVLDKWWASRR